MSGPPGPRAAAAQPATHQPLRLDIRQVIESADNVASHVARELPGHPGLARAARGVAEAARQAARVARRLRRPFGAHRLPAAFLLISVGALGLWTYWQFFHISQLVIAVSARDAVHLKEKVLRRIRIVKRETVGSQESVEQLRRAAVDLAFIQGGVEIPEELLRVELEEPELLLFFLRDGVDPQRIRKVLTSSEGQGSHALAQVFARAWGLEGQVAFSHDWRVMTDDPNYALAPDIDAVFVVKDPLNRKLDGVAARLRGAGLRLASPDIGAMSLRLPYLREFEIRPGFLDPAEAIPEEAVKTYSVATYLVARPDLTSRQLAAASHLVDKSNRLPEGFEPTLGTANEAVQGVEAVLNILVYIGLAFLALLGLDVFAYRRRFNELNTLVSLISMHQSSKDVIGGDDAQRAWHVAYLSVCSDLLGLIAVITGYYAQENASLLYNRLLEIIHERCSGLKINIQLKILHALVDLPIPGAGGAEPPADASG